MPAATTAVGSGLATKQADSGAWPLWEYYLLRALGTTATTAKLQALNLWAKAEGMPGDTNNWLAITDPNGEFGATGGDPAGAVATGVWNDIGGQPGVVTFKSFTQGISATVSFLMHGHSGVVTALRDPSATVTSIGTAVAQDGAWGGDGAAIIAGAGATGDTASIYTGGSATGTADSKPGSGTSSSFYMCNSANVLVGEPGILGVGKWNILNACQAKAIVGGLIIGVGAFIMVGGVVLLVTGTVEKFGLKSLAKQVSGAFGTATKVTLGAGGVSRAPANDPDAGLSPQQRSYKAENPEGFAEARRRQRAAGIIA